MKRRGFLLGLPALLAAGLIPRAVESAAPLGLRPVSGIRVVGKAPGIIRRLEVHGDGLWVRWEPDAKCQVKRMVKQWEGKGLYIGDPIVKVG